jgi:phage I-like protein
MVINNKKYYHIFTAGKYPQAQKEFTVEMLWRIAQIYNKVTVHEAPFWIGHIHPADRFRADDEQRAIAWVDTVIVIENKLFVSLSYASDQFKYLIENKDYKYVSAEFDYYTVDGKEELYLHACALTNRPAVQGMEALSLPQQFNFESHNYKPGKGTPIYFELQNDLQNQINNQMNEFLKSIAKSLGLDLSKFTTDSSLSEAIIKTQSDKFSEIGTLKDAVDTLNEKFNKLPGAAAVATGTETIVSPDVQKLIDRINDMEARSFEQAVDNAISAKKFTAAQRESLIILAKKDITAFNKFVDATPVNSVFDGKRVDDKTLGKDIDLTNPKFNKADGTPYSYEEIRKNPDLENTFTEDELMALRAKSKFAKIVTTAKS